MDTPTMKKLSVSIAALALAISAGSAFAADLPSRKEAVVPPPPPPTWTGLYAGVNIGGGWNAGNGNANVWNLNGWNGGVSNNLSSGVIGGGQVGYNYQLGGLNGALPGGLGRGIVVGAEADFQGTSMGSGGYNWSQPGVALNWFGTVRGRLGLGLTPALLVYGTGGFAYGSVNRNGVLYYQQGYTASQTGWTAGGGVEYMLTAVVSTKLEYLYTDLSGGNTNTWSNWGVGLNNVNNHTRWNTVRAGVNYHINFGGAPVIAAY
jgi:outer membrane immunogenic protein